MTTLLAEALCLFDEIDEAEALWYRLYPGLRRPDRACSREQLRVFLEEYERGQPIEEEPHEVLTPWIPLGPHELPVVCGDGVVPLWLGEYWAWVSLETSGRGTRCGYIPRHCFLRSPSSVAASNSGATSRLKGYESEPVGREGAVGEKLAVQWEPAAEPPLDLRHEPLPPPPPREGSPPNWLEEGAAVSLDGLTKASRFNGLSVQLERHGLGVGEKNAWVRLPSELGGLLVDIPTDALCRLRLGAIVELVERREVGTVIGHEEDTCSYRVQLANKEQEIVVLPGTVLRPRSRLFCIDFNRSRNCLTWKQEQECIFVDSTNRQRMFFLHLPTDWSERHRQESRGPARWPLIVYMHGAGGGSFFTYSKRTLQSEGFRFAGQNFAVVSPRCEWSWQGSPASWVEELVRELGAAAWIDAQKIYLTGCSMGGMSTWEIGARSPSLFAAVAPVAAHHKDEKRDMIAKGLRGRPVCVHHSSQDDTCPIAKEEQLWKRFSKDGGGLSNSNLRLNVHTDVDHCTVFRRAYCETDLLYRWFLDHKNEAD